MYLWVQHKIALLYTTMLLQAYAQFMSFTPVLNNLENNKSVPTLWVPPFNNKNEELFDPDYARPYYKKRKYVFGGYIVRDWNLGINAATARSGQYPIFLKHEMCGAGFYSPQFRLDNPPPANKSEWNYNKEMPSNEYKSNGLLKGVHYYFRGGKYLLAAPCCPFADKFNKCCRKTSSPSGGSGINAVGNSMYSGGQWVAAGGQQGWDCDIYPNVAIDPITRISGMFGGKQVKPRANYENQAICDNGNDQNRACSRMALECASTVRFSVFKMGLEYTPRPDDLFNLGRYSIPNEGTSGTCSTNCAPQCIKKEVPGKSRSLDQFFKIKKFCSEDNIRMRAFWGPIEYDMKTIDGIPYRTHDMFWAKSQQCKSCTRFGMMYYSGIQYNSLCTKVGPGETATPDGTDVEPSAITRMRYVSIKNPKNPDDATQYMCKDGTEVCTSHFTSDYRVIIDMTSGANVTVPTGTLQVRGTRIVSGNNDKKEFSVDMEIGPKRGKGSDRADSRCMFDGFSDLLQYNEIMTASSCKIPTIIPITWPTTCAGHGGTDTCSVIASVTKSSNVRGGGGASVPAGTGDTRLFAHVTLGEQVDSPGRPSTENSNVRYYRNNVYSGIFWAMGYELTYELAVLVRKASKRGCGSMNGGTQDVDSVYNYFTYYYPHYGNYELKSQGSLTFVESYKFMITEQRKVMVTLRNLEDTSEKSAPRPMPVKGRCPASDGIQCETVAPCYKRRDGICDPNNPTMKYEALPAQSSSSAAAARGGILTPQWPLEKYYGDFPNYDKADVQAGWVKADGTGEYKTIEEVAAKLHVVKDLISNKNDGMRVLRAAAACVPCRAGWEGSRQANTATFKDALTNVSKTVQTGRFLRAGLGPLGKKDVYHLGLRVSFAEYSTVCSPCLPGSYNPMPGKSCKRCPGGTFSMSTRRSGIPAFYANSAPMKCWPCLKGFECPRLGREHNKVCTVETYGNMCPCAMNYYQDERGQTQCKKCPDDTATAQIGSKSKSDCKKGAVRPGYRFRGPYDRSIDVGGPTPKQMEQVPCEKGTYSSISRLFSPNSISCAVCGPGTYAPLTGSAFCYPCPIGEYNNLTGQHACKKCECADCTPKPGPGDNVNVRVTTTKTACLQAPENKFSVHYDDTSWSDCPCALPRRTKSAIECAAPSGYTVEQRKALSNACSKSLIYIVNNWTNGTQKDLIEDISGGTVDSKRKIRTSAGVTDWLTMISLILSFPLIFISMALGMSSGIATIQKDPNPKKGLENHKTE